MPVHERFERDLIAFMAEVLQMFLVGKIHLFHPIMPRDGSRFLKNVSMDTDSPSSRYQI